MALTLGPETDNPIQDMGSLVKISLPYDLRPIGINYKLEDIPETVSDYSIVPDTVYSDLTELPRADCLFKINMGDEIRPDGTSYKSFKIQGIDVNGFTRSIRIDGEFYEYSAYVGEGAPIEVSTLHWPIYKFKNKRTSKEICVMFRVLNTEFLKSAFISEVIIHHILYESTKYDTHDDCCYVPEFRVFRATFPVTDNQTGSVDSYMFGVYIIKTELEGTYDSILDAGVADEGAEQDDVDENGVSTAVIQIARKLDRLYELYKFNHGDLSPSSIVYKRNSSGKKQYLLNNFVVSSLQLDTDTESKCIINLRNKPIREDFDIPTLITYLKAYKFAYQPGGYLYNFGNYVVPDDLYDIFYIFNNLKPWAGIYSWLYGDLLKTNLLINGIPIHVLTYFNQGPAYITGGGECDPPMIEWTGSDEPTDRPLTQAEIILRIVRSRQQEANTTLNAQFERSVAAYRGKGPRENRIYRISLKSKLETQKVHIYNKILQDTIRRFVRSPPESFKFISALTNVTIAENMEGAKLLWKEDIETNPPPRILGATERRAAEVAEARAAAAEEAARPKPMPLKYKVAAGVFGLAAAAEGVRIVASQAVQLIAAHPIGAATSVAALALYGFFKSSTNSSNKSAGGFIRSVRNKKKHSTRRALKKIIRVKKQKQTKRNRNYKRSK